MFVLGGGVIKKLAKIIVLPGQKKYKPIFNQICYNKINILFTLSLNVEGFTIFLDNRFMSTSFY